MAGEIGVNTTEYQLANAAEGERQDILSDIKSSLVANNGTVGNDVTMVLEGDHLAKGIDISTGPGALALDDILNQLGTIQQTAAQLKAHENKQAKQIKQQGVNVA